MHWRLRRGDRRAAESVSKALRLCRPVGRVLASRGYSEVESARAFLEPALTDLHDPFLLDQMDEAAGCIADAVRAGRRIVIFGDYDADGICGSSVLYRLLKALGADVQVMIPSRLRDGYSLNGDAVSRIVQAGARLTITVDNGTGAVREAADLAAAGVDLIVADHHEPGSSIPTARAILNPKMPDSAYPYRDLCAAGVAFKLAWALSQRGPVDEEKARSILLDSLGIVALATVADVSPLTGENRVLVTFGLRALLASRNPGVCALLRGARLRQGRIDARDVAFRLAPMLNAPGRLGEASLSLALLVSESESEAASIVREMGRINRQRQAIQKEVLESARPHVRREMDLGRPALVLAADGWHPGVTGIVAGRIARESKLPTILISLEGEAGRGSARSAGDVFLPRVLDACKDLLVSHGGHGRAAGLVIDRGNVQAFRERFCEAAGNSGANGPPEPREADAEVELGEVLPRTVVELARLAPFGEANPPPVLLARRCRVAGAVRPLRRGLSFFLRQGDVALRARTRDGPDLPAGAREQEKLTVAFRPEAGRSGEIDLEVLGFPETVS